ncbi:MAG TPA: tetratricopeptide repeat protein [Xanthobacteraceae bacterium]|nr:tetratricopeptide repeat protein [Xanthobacteraceae bacterium]
MAIRAIIKALRRASGMPAIPGPPGFGWLGALAMLALVILAPARAAAEGPVKGEISVAVAEEGYARLVFRLAEEVESEVRIANGIVIVAFKRPVDIAVDRVAAGASDYIGAARRDPDGMGVRIALARKVRVNSMAAGERLFVDLLPEPWVGVIPGLPQDVIDDLTRRAREAEKRARQQVALVQQRKQGLIRVRVGKQPTFTRYSFDLPRSVAVANDRVKNEIKLTFDAPLKFDLADAQAEQPASLESIETEANSDSISLRFILAAKVDVRTFREEGSYVVDIGHPDPKKQDGQGEQSTGSDTPNEELRESETPQPSETRQAARTEPRSSAPSAEAALSSAPAAPAEAPAKRAVAAPRPPAAPVPAPKIAPASPASAPAAKIEQAAPPAGPPSVQAMPAPAPGPGPAPVIAEPPKPAGRAVAGAVVAEMRQGDDLRIKFPFEAPTPAAVFRRADTLWVVFDTQRDMDVQALDSDASGTIRSAALTRSDDAQVLRIKLERPRLASLAVEGAGWLLTISDTIETPTRPLMLTRNIASPMRSSVIIPFEEPRRLHRIADPDVGDNLLVITALGPARGFLKNQDFVEFRALASTHGVVLQPLADDLNAELSADKILVGRPAGLTLSTGGYGDTRSGVTPVVFDPQLWGFDRQANFIERQSLLLRMAAEASEQRRNAARLDLARFYLAQGLDAEAKAVLDIALSAGRLTAEDAPSLVLRSISEIRMERPDDALKDLSNPLVGNQYDAPLWRALAYTQQGKYADAREGFKNVAAAIGTLPIELQRLALQKAVQAFIEVRDFAGAAALLNEFETIGVPRELEPRLTLLSGRLAEGLGRTHEALTAYRTAANSSDRPAAAQARLRQIALRALLGDLSRREVISELERLAVTWRGDQTEVETLQVLARLYTEESRYRDAFYTMRSAMLAHPNSEMTRRIHDEAATTFDSLFLGGKGDGLPTIDALALFYDFRELTPIGRRGDEMIRRLSDRLVGVDLLDQAAELLQYQIDHRLQGAARVQVATRLAVIYLMNRKADRALATLRATRTADLPNELRNQRLLVEARALSDMKRHDVALEIIAHVPGREAIRLRSDILWAARRWAEAAEQLELLYGTRWQEWAPLAESERADVLRAAIGFALGEDAIGLIRFREKYAAKMADGADRRAFDVITASTGDNSAEFREVARSVAAVDTLDAFLRALRTRFPDAGAASGAATGEPGKQGQAPLPAGAQQAAAR